MTMPSDMRAFNRSVVENFRANDGEITLEGMLNGADLVLLTTTGAKTGREHTVPLGYATDGERIVLWASNMAAPAHPAWYRNLVVSPEVFIERPTDSGVDRYPARATTATGAERDRLLAVLRDQHPNMAAHQDQTEREIPLVIIERLPR